MKKKRKLAEIEKRFTPQEAALKAGCSYRTVMNAIRAGNLRALPRWKGSRLKVILERDLVAWIEGGPVKRASGDA